MFQIFSKKPEIIFRCRPDVIEALPHPSSASKFMPKWFKSLSRDIEGSDVTAAGTVKRCVPVIEAISQGYIIPLWADLHIKVSRNYRLCGEDGSTIGMACAFEKPDLIGKDFEGSKVFDIEEEGLHIWCKFPDGFDAGSGGDIGKHSWQQVGDQCDLKKFELGPVLLKLINPWVIETSKGWSVQFKNPANNWENDIHILEGVVDTDTYHQQVNFPYVWTGDKVGEWIIPKGTPLIQVNPFKRQKIKKGIGTFNEVKMAKARALLMSTFVDRYRRFFWHKGSK